MSEVAVARVLVEHLRAEGWRVHQEVSVHGYGEAADVVAVRGSLVMVVEAKTSFTLKVIEQAERWAAYAHLVALAVPSAGRDRHFAERIATDLGIGVFYVQPQPPNDGAWEEHHPEFRRPERSLLAKLRAALVDGNENGLPAGSPRGARLTPFRRTVAELRKFVEGHPGVTVSEAVEKVETHYQSKRSARACLSKLIRDGVVEGLRLDNGKLFVTGGAA